VGVDVSENRGLDVVVLDSDRHLAVAPERRMSPGGLGRLLGSLGDDVGVVAIDSPPGPGLSGPSRACELVLRRRGVPVFSTPSDPARFARPFYNWVRVGARAFEAARSAGFGLFVGGDSVEHRAVEVFPHASDVFLRGHRPPSGVTRRAGTKRRWRTETLRRAGMEEVDQLRSLDAVDAALAAVTGLHGLERNFEAVGEPPFLIVVPAAAVDGPNLRWP
jgi:predicted nuclease with RNAse H fold